MPGTSRDLLPAEGSETVITILQQLPEALILGSTAARRGERSAHRLTARRRLPGDVPDPRTVPLHQHEESSASHDVGGTSPGLARRLAMLDEALQGTSQTHDS